MKGLLYKDFITLKGYAKPILFMMAIFIAVSFVNEEYLKMLTFMIPFIIIMMSINTFSYDIYTKWDSFSLTLPITKKDMVLSKYILAIILIILGSLIGLIVPILISLITSSAIDIETLLSTIMGVAAGMSLVIIINFPLIFKFGPEKGRIYLFIGMFLISVIIAGIAFLFKEFLNGSYIINKSLPFITNYGWILLILIIFLLMFISYRISYNIYNKKEF